MIITGGIHTSYNAGSTVFKCELEALHKNLVKLRKKHGGGTAPVIWMGDLNAKSSDNRFKFAVTFRGYPEYHELAGLGDTPSYWSYCKGKPIDHICGTKDVKRLDGGKAGGQCKQWLAGADHFPIWAKVSVGLSGGGSSHVFSQSHLRPISSTPTHLSL